MCLCLVQFRIKLCGCVVKSIWKGGGEGGRRRRRLKEKRWGERNAERERETWSSPVLPWTADSGERPERLRFYGERRKRKKKVERRLTGSGES